MRLDTEFIRLPLRLDAERLAGEVAAVPESAWRPHPQGHKGNSALPLVAAHGDPGNDATKGPMRPTPNLAGLPYLRQVLAAFETVIGRTRLMRLDGNAEATAHSDTNYYWLSRVRIHVPVVTTPGVRFLCGKREVHMAPGQAWLFDTWKVHNVLNPDPTRRIHLVADSVGSPRFWELARRGERPFDAASAPAAADRVVPWNPAADPALVFETVNQPTVMTPWELESHFRWIIEELATSAPAQAGLVHELAAELTAFRGEWYALWIEHGTAPAGFDAYRACLDALGRRVARFEKRLPLGNGIDAVEMVRQTAIRPGLNPELAEVAAAVVPHAGTAPTAEVAPAVAPAPARPRSPRERFDRPVFVVAPPRSGTSLLFETLAGSPDLWTVGGESHAQIEGIPALHPAAHDWESNRLGAADATPEVVATLAASFLADLRDRDGARERAITHSQSAPAASGLLRLLEKTPKNALRVPFLAAAFPDALFVYLYRDPRETVSSMLDAWRSGRFVTYPGLPGWHALPWSLVLAPGWRELVGKPLAEVVARQWSATTETLLRDLEGLPAERWSVASYDRLVASPQEEIERLCAVVGVRWDRQLTAPLPNSRHTLTSPEPEKWRHNAEELRPVLTLLEGAAAHAREVFASPPAVRPARRRNPADAATATGPTLFAPVKAAARKSASAASTAASEPASFQSVFTSGVPQLLREAGVSLLVSTYQSGRVIVVRADGDSLNTHFRAFPSPMGMALGPRYLAIGTQHHVWEYRNQPALAKTLTPPDRHDAVYVPRRAQVTGDIRIHELAFQGDELWAVNTRFSCLCTFDADHSFVPRWRPRFVSALRPEDRCHLNGLAVDGAKLRYVTALGETDTPQGWRERKASGGVLIDLASGETVARGLSMPHSPRLHGGKLWVLESGKGTLASVDPASGSVDTVVELPGFTRGLAFVGPYALVGLSQVRESNIFGGLPLTERLQERLCGVWIVDLRSGAIAGFLRFEGIVQEIFDVQIVRSRWPELAEPASDLVAGAFVLPQEALDDVARTSPATAG